MSKTVEGGCHCGQVRYTCSGEPIAVTLCYCRDCQRFSGGANSNYVLMPADSVSVTGETAGNTLQAESQRSVRREYCRECGSPVFAKTPHLFAITVASFDDPNPYQPTLAIWLASAPPWASVPQGIPSYQHNPPLSDGEAP
jgi:hypothetical protein